MKVNEIYKACSGEGLSSGRPATIIRFQGCNLKPGCQWCDTSYAQSLDGGVDMTVSDIIGHISTHLVLISGGEPLHQDIMPLLETIKSEAFCEVEVETNGTIEIPSRVLSKVDSWVVDVKCPGSGVSKYNYYGNLAHLRGTDQVKFVVSDRADFDFALDCITKYGIIIPEILFSPVFGKIDAGELADWVIKENIVNSRLSLQLHKLIKRR